MKKVLLLVIGLVSLTSCQQDECTEVVCVERVTSARMSPTIIDLGGMSGNMSINSSGGNSAYQTTGDLNLNGFKLTLTNIQLTVVGNMNGNGNGGGSQVSTLGTSTVCVQGNIQNDPYYNDNDFTCDSLSGGSSSSVYDGELEVPCGEVSMGELFRVGYSWYKVVECY